MPEESEEENAYGDISSKESVDGLVVPTTNPFYPNIEFRYSDDGDFEGYKVDFNQGYIFNRVSANQLQDISDTGICTISQMKQSFELDKEHDKKFYVEASISASNFLIESAIFTGFDAGGDQPTTEFPQILFADEVEKASYTGYFPVLQLKNGSLIEYTQRNNIFLSDRQFKQLGAQGSPRSAGVGSSFVGQAQVLVKEGKGSEDNPVRVRAVKGDGTVKVFEEANYIIISGSGQGFTGENIGGGAEVYVEASTDPAQFRTLTGAENIEISIVGDTVEIKSEDINCTSAQWNAYVDGTKNPAQFRGLNFGDGIIVSNGTSCAPTISVDTGCCDLQNTTDVGSFTTNNITINSSVDVGTAPLNVVTDTTTHEAITVWCGGSKVQEYKTDSSCNGVIEVNDSSETTVNKLTASSSLGNYFNTHTAIGATSPDTNYSLYVNGNVKIQDSSNANNGKLQFGSNTDNTIEIDQSNGEFKFGAGVSSLESSQSDTIHVFSETSADYSARACSIVGGSPATGSAILGGSGNSISGHFDVIVAGVNNAISGGFYSFIGGGTGIDITGSSYSSSIGGLNNDIFGSDYAIIGGGDSNKIEDSDRSFVGGGTANHIVGGNFSTIGGGQNNIIKDKSSLIGGGESNEIRFQAANGGYNFIGAGVSNIISGGQSSIAGGNNNIISGSRSVTLGGSYQNIAADDAVTAGNYSKVQPTHDGAFVFSDSTTTPSLSSGTNSMVMDFANGVYVNTNTALYVNGNAVLTGETPEGDTLQSVTSRGNETTTSIISTGPYISGVTGLFSDNVGIGTTSPSVPLHLYSAEAQMNFESSHGRTSSIYQGGGNFHIRASHSNGVAINYADSNAALLNLYNSTTAAVSLRANGVSYFNGGNVGIGTTNPIAPLDVDGNIYSNGALLVDRILSRGGSTDLKLDARSGYGVNIRGSGNASIAYFDYDSGNVGIGTTSPSDELEVYKNGSDVAIRIHEDAGTHEARLHLRRGGNDWEIINNSDLAFEIEGSEIARFKTNGNVGIGTASPTGQLQSVAPDGSKSSLRLGRSDTSIFWDFNHAGGDLRIWNSAASGSDILLGVDAGGTAKNNNVGIGTASPSANLHVEGATQVKGANSWAGIDTQNGAIYMSDVGQGLLGNLGSNYARPLISTASQTIIIGSSGTSAIRNIKYQAGNGSGVDSEHNFFTSGNNIRLHIATDGKVGIGADTPQRKLDVTLSGNSGVDASFGGLISVGEYQGIHFGYSETANNLYRKSAIVFERTDSTSNNAQGKIHILNGPQTGSASATLSDAKLTIAEDGNVGIGTTAPNSNLHVYAASNAPTFRISRASNGQVWTQTIDSSARFLLQEAASEGGTLNTRLSIDDAGETLLCMNGGSCGIGTVSVNQNGSKTTLDIHHATVGAAIRLRQGSNSALIRYDDTDGLQVGTIASKNLSFETADTTAITIDTSQNVGIGTTSPAYKLHVSGSLGTTNQLYFTGTTADIQIGSSWGNGVLNFKNGATTAITFDVPNNRIQNNLGKYLTSSSGTGQFGTLDNQSVAIVANNSTQMTILSSGNVGIGTTNPNDQDLNINAPKLHVVGQSTTGAFNLVARFQGGNDNDNTGAAILINHSNDRGLLINAGRADSDREVAYFNLVSSGAVVTNVLTLRKVGSYHNAGIGVEDPDAKLEIKGSTSGTGAYSLRVRNSNDNELLTVRDDGVVIVPNQYFYVSSNGGAYVQNALRVRGSLLNDQGTLSITGDVNFDSDTMFVDSTNNRVGIGTTSPAAILNVATSVDECLRFTDTATTNANDIRAYQQYYASNNTSRAGYLGFTTTNTFDIATTTASGKIRFLAGNNAQAMLIAADGKVGIGINNPVSKLHVYQNDSATTTTAGITIEQDGTGDAQLQFLLSNAYRWVQGIDNDDGDKFKIGRGNGWSIGADITVDTSGNVGIGTTSPDYELHVIGTASFTDTVAGAYFEENASNPELKELDTGTILVMDEEGEIVPSCKANDTMVFGASKRGYKQPIVMGAEPIKMTGPIKVGDFITTSSKYGHGMRSETKEVGTIIAQAMESGDGDSYNIKAMIRKM